MHHELRHKPNQNFEIIKDARRECYYNDSKWFVLEYKGHGGIIIFPGVEMRTPVLNRNSNISEESSKFE